MTGNLKIHKVNVMMKAQHVLCGHWAKEPYTSLFWDEVTCKHCLKRRK